MQSLSPHMEPCPGALGTPRGEKLDSQWEAGLGDQTGRGPHARPGEQPRKDLEARLTSASFPTPTPSPERPHLNLWLEAPDLLLAEIDLPKLVSARSTAAGG